MKITNFFTDSMVKKWGVIIIALILFKGGFSIANVNQLQWLLYPITAIVELFTTIDFTWTSNIGYTSSLNIIIEKSCSGGNFFIICMLLLLIKNWNPYAIKLKTVHLLFILFMSYVITVLANSMRIISAIKLVYFRQLTHYIDPKNAHLLLGSIIYILILLSLNHLISIKHEQA